MIVDTAELPPRVAHLVEVLRANAESIEATERCRIEVACQGNRVHFRLLPVTEPVLDLRRLVYGRVG